MGHTLTEDSPGGGGQEAWSGACSSQDMGWGVREVVVSEQGSGVFILVLKGRVLPHFSRPFKYTTVLVKILFEK